MAGVPKGKVILILQDFSSPITKRKYKKGMKLLRDDEALRMLLTGENVWCALVDDDPPDDKKDDKKTEAGPPMPEDDQPEKP